MNMNFYHKLQLLINLKIAENYIKNFLLGTPNIPGGFSEGLVRKKNFPPEGKNNKYLKKQAKDFSWKKVVEQLIQFHGMREVIPDFKEKNIKTVWMRSMVIFYKYYLDSRKIKLSSDFGDLFHTSQCCKILFLINYFRFKVEM